MINPNFVYLGVFLQAVGGFSYLRDTVKGKIKPNKVSWLLWSVAPLIAFAAELSQGVGIQALTTFIVGFIPLLVFAASFLNRQAEWKLGKLDIACGILSAAGIALWLLTREGNIAIFFSIMADGLAAVPTIIKSYNDPESENDLLYIFGVVNAGIGLLTIKTGGFVHWGFPVYLLFCNLLVAVLIRFKIGRHGKRAHI